MKIEWLGHACFRITTQSGTVIVTDPYDESVGYGALCTSADVVSASHQHHDHNCLSAVSGYKKLYDAVCDEKYSDVRVSAAASFHDDAQGAKRGGNLLFAFEADSQRVVHLGDLGHLPDVSQLAFMRGADALLIPIGGFYTIDTPTALEIIELARPRAAVAMHFRNRHCGFPISTADEFVKKTNARQLSGCAELSEMRGALVFEL